MYKLRDLLDTFKKAEVRPLYKKDGKTEKSNYRLISALSNISKIYERCLHDQIYSYFVKIYSIYQCSKGISIQQSLLTKVEKIKISRDNKQFLAAILTDLSKTCGSIPYDLLITELNANCFDQEALKLVQSYLCDRSQKVDSSLARN